MITLTSLWLSILLAGILVFVVSSITHMVLPLHKGDYAPLPGEDAIAEAMRKAGVGAGEYVMPYCKSMGEMGSEAMRQRYRQGPNAFVTVMKPGPPAMGKSLVLWFVYTLVVGVFVAYITGRTVAPGAEYLQVFRVAGAVAFVAYALPAPVASIWKAQKWGTSLKFVVDGLLYSLVTAGAFAGFWPGV